MKINKKLLISSIVLFGMVFFAGCNNQKTEKEDSEVTEQETEMDSPMQEEYSLANNQEKVFYYHYNGERKSIDFSSYVKDGAKLVHVQHISSGSLVEPATLEYIYKNKDGSYDIAHNYGDGGFETEDEDKVFLFEEDVKIVKKEKIENDYDLCGEAIYYSCDGYFWNVE